MTTAAKIIIFGYFVLNMKSKKCTINGNQIGYRMMFFYSLVLVDYKSNLTPLIASFNLWQIVHLYCCGTYRI